LSSTPLPKRSPRNSQYFTASRPAESQTRIQRDRLRIDTRKWMAARLAPKK
jgi:hypothetical protein